MFKNQVALKLSEFWFWHWTPAVIYMTVGRERFCSLDPAGVPFPWCWQRTNDTRGQQQRSHHQLEIPALFRQRTPASKTNRVCTQLSCQEILGSGRGPHPQGQLRSVLFSPFPAQPCRSLVSKSCFPTPTGWISWHSQHFKVKALKYSVQRFLPHVSVNKTQNWNNQPGHEAFSNEVTAQAPELASPDATSDGSWGGRWAVRLQSPEQGVSMAWEKKSPLPIQRHLHSSSLPNDVITVTGFSYKVFLPL